jgi:hypothetical protein
MQVNKAFLVNSCRICLKLQNDPLESDHKFIDRAIQKVFYEITSQKVWIYYKNHWFATS